MSSFFREQLPEPPYYAVIFSSLKKRIDSEYQATAEKMIELAKTMPGFLGYESISSELASITISYWTDLESIANWKHHPDHLKAQERGKSEWYESYTIRISRVESNHEFGRLF
ncbi:MAG: antibiotic biosynthesis monooxygenase [Calditrichia bacterium]